MNNLSIRLKNNRIKKTISDSRWGECIRKVILHTSKYIHPEPPPHQVKKHQVNKIIPGSRWRECIIKLILAYYKTYYVQTSTRTSIRPYVRLASLKYYWHTTKYYDGGAARSGSKCPGASRDHDRPCAYLNKY